MVVLLFFVIGTPCELMGLVKQEKERGAVEIPIFVLVLKCLKSSNVVHLISKTAAGIFCCFTIRG